jgi:thioredoxin 1
MAGTLGEISDSSFESEVVKSGIPVIVDFWAPWCAPCKRIAPILEELAQEYDGKVAIKKMNIDDNPLTPTKFNVRGIPNIVFFKNGEMVDQLVGAVPKEALTKAIETSLLG